MMNKPSNNSFEHLRDIFIKEIGSNLSHQKLSPEEDRRQKIIDDIKQGKLKKE